ncbi:MAG: ATP-dependent Clp protease adapter ClpS [Desulfovibrio sp.]|nr:ATP-dependent Clp protease adapter ClpS [Desulfovibrio sp.]MBR4422879.1 ATP-dependent Clp protease adapter ClpS [Mailhella sp.]
MSQNHNADPSIEAGVIVENELKEPDMYRVLLHNDDYTQMDFVVQVLVEIFRKSNEEAVAIMMSVHNTGSGVCGVYPREIAEFRVSQVERRAKDAGFPLLCTMEKD